MSTAAPVATLGATRPPGPTPEQQAIVDSSASFLRVNAFAGTGKTTTLVAYAKARPRQRMLYLAFNKGIQLEATRKFPSYVKCVTSHAMAFPQFGSTYANANKLVDRLRVNQVADALPLKEYPEHFRYYVADVTLKTLNRYLASDAAQVENRFTDGLLLPDMGARAQDIVGCVNLLWARMCDPADHGIGQVHDGYLKLYQLSGPKLRYDTILFDEAQDANPVTSALVDAQQAAKVVVGDAHQAIYSWRGAVNAMRRFQAEQTLYLTKSFRFGQPIAEVANAILSAYKGERRSIIGTDEPARIGALPPNTQYTLIARANATLFDAAVTAVAAGNAVHFVGGIGGYRLGDVLDVYNLWANQQDRINSPYLRAFGDFDTAEGYAGLSDDKELKSLINVVRRHGAKVPKLIDRIRNGAVDTAEEADVLFTTAHKSKGLEWDQVRLADDYMDLLDNHKKPRKLEFAEEEEANILYVAATRARRNLEVFPDLTDLLAIAKVERAASARAAQVPDWARPFAAAKRA